MSESRYPVLLVVLDGWGHSDAIEGNAIRAAATPVWDRIWRDCPHTLIRCSGADVGLPDAQMGNSEVGHMHMGAGRVINQELTRITCAIESGEFFDNDVLNEACRTAAVHDRAVHVLGLLSPGGVHSHERHIVALIELAQRCGVRRIYVHAFLDGRDTPPQSARTSLAVVQAACGSEARLATLVGRYYAMDRNSNWDRTARACDLIVNARGEHRTESAAAGLDAAYARGETDEFVHATVIGDYPGMQDGDVVLFANFRADRARQLTTALAHEDFTGFQLSRRAAPARVITMTDYGDQFCLPVAFPAQELHNSFGEVIARRGLRQLRIAETEKYAHVTFFFNGGVEAVYPGEDRELIPSPDVATFDLKPEMSAVELTDKLVAAIDSGRYDVIISNYANADMVGHTGNFAAAVRCIEVLDECLGRLLKACAAAGMDLLITSDHGNAEKMFADAPDMTVAGGARSAHTAHTSNLVPLVYVGRPADIAGDGSLIDIAPTMLRLLDLEVPAEMTGRPLVQLRGARSRADVRAPSVAENV